MHVSLALLEIVWSVKNLDRLARRAVPIVPRPSSAMMVTAAAPMAALPPPVAEVMGLFLVNQGPALAHHP